MGHFFISYARADEAFAKELRNRLAEYEIPCLLDLEIAAGGLWVEIIDQWIRDSLGVIVLVSDQSLHSYYVTYEWAFAMGIGKDVIPLLLEDTTFTIKEDQEVRTHHKLKKPNFIPFFNELQRESSWEKLLKDLLFLSGQNEIPDIVRQASKDLNSSDSKVRVNAITTLEYCEHPSAARALVVGMQNPITDVKIGCAIALAHHSKFQNETTFPVLAKAASSDEQFVPAIHTLLAYRSIEGYEALYEIYNNADSSKRNLWVERVVGHRDQNFIPILLKVLPTCENASAIVGALGASQATEAFEDIMGYLKSRPMITGVFEQAVNTLTKINHPKAANGICEILLRTLPLDRTDHTSVNVFNTCTRRLYEYDDPSVVDALEEILKTPKVNNNIEIRNDINGLLIRKKQKLGIK